MTDNRKPHKQRSIDKIKNGNILDRLIKHFNGEIELSATQANIGLSLIKKYLPDMKLIEQTGEVTVRQTVINAQPDEDTESWQKKYGQSGDHSEAHKPH